MLVERSAGAPDRATRAKAVYANEMIEIVAKNLGQLRASAARTIK